MSYNRIHNLVIFGGGRGTNRTVVGVGTDTEGGRETGTLDSISDVDAGSLD
jgi:hypothetical protein